MSLDVAIVGTGVLVPDARGAEALWRNLLDGRDAVTEADGADWAVDPQLLFDPRRGVPDRTCSLLGGFVRDDAPAPEGPLAEALGRLVAWPVAVGRDALRDAGLAGGADLTRCGLVLGGYPWAVSRPSQRLFGALYDAALGLDGTRDDAELPAGVADILLSGSMAPTVACALGLGGACYSIDAACATTLYALKLAALQLRAGRADVMLAGASSAYDPVFTFLGFSTLQALPENSRSRPLDARSDGLAPAEGCCMFVCKRHEDALRDGDRIHGVVRAIGLSSDGRGQHLLAPGRRGQISAYERAYAEAGLDRAAVAYVECHATGTRVGDRVEAAGIDAFFGRTAEPRPLLGSVKSNLGHLLTAAGGASLVKAMLALEHGTIPATIGVGDPLALDDGTSFAGRIVAEARPWPDGGKRPRCAGVNAFGFGGTNAHLVLEQAAGAASPPAPPQLEAAPLAIVGMDAAFGPAHGLDAFARTVYDGGGPSVPPAGRRRGLGGGQSAAPGAYLADFEIDALRYRMPPRELERLSAQHLLALTVADRALQDAGIEPGGRVAVLVALAAEPSIHRLQARWELPGRDGADACENVEAAQDGLHRGAQTGDFIGYIGNLAASRIASLWDFSGPAFALAAGANGTQRCLDLAGLLLGHGEAEAVLVAAVDLAGSPESVLVRGARAGGFVGEGAGALVLRRLGDAGHDAERSYATVRGVHVEEPSGGRAAADVVAASARHALAAARADAADVGYLELAGGDAEADGLRRAYGAGAPATCAIGGVRAHVGNAFAAAGMAAVVRAALCLSGRYLPRGGEPAGALAGGRFYTCDEPRPWLRDAARPRVAAVHGLAADGSSAHVLLEEAPGARARRPPSLAQPGRAPLLTVPVTGDSIAALLDGLAGVEAELAGGAALADVASRATAAAADAAGAPLAACVVGRGVEEVRAEARLARAALPAGRRWQTPAGSAFAPSPLGGTGGLAFVYPGLNAIYPGVGRELFALAPELHDRLERRFASPREATCDALLFPRLAHPPTAPELEQLEECLTGAPATLIAAGVTCAALFSWVLRDGLGLVPDCALGFSVGELAMLFGMGVWEPGDEWLGRLAVADALHERLGGRRDAVRAHWGLREHDELQWCSWVVLAEAEAVGQLAARYDDVYVTAICAPAEVVIAGRPASCRALIADAGVDAFRAPDALALHCPPARQEHDRLVQLLRHPVAAVPQARLHLSAGDLALGDPEALAAAVATGVCEQANFPAVVERAWAGGTRVFVEVGAGATCSRWIGETLRGRDHLAVPASRRGTAEGTSVARLVAALVAERVPLDLAAWGAGMAGRASPAPAGLPWKVELGGPPIQRLRRRPSTAQPLERVAEPAVAAARPLPGVGAWAPAAGTATLPPAAHEAVLAARRASTAHRTMLRSSDAVLSALAGELATRIGNGAPATRAASPPRRVLYDEADVLEFAEGRLSRVLGSVAAKVDELPLRVRFPSPPFLAVSRVTALDAQWGRIGPGSISTEYDIPSPAWHAVDGQASYLALDAQGVLFLLAAMGVDLDNRGRRAFRWLDATITFLGDMPRAGDTIAYDIAVTSFVREGDALLFFSDYEGRVNGAPVMRIDRCCAGFFTHEELARGRGITAGPRPAAAAPQPARDGGYPLTCERRTFDDHDLAALHRGDVAACFGAAHGQAPPNPSLRLPPAPMRMIDRIFSVDPYGGSSGLGAVVAEKLLHPDDWYLRAHFKDDPVFAGPCMLEGSLQLLQFLALFGGLHTRTRAARFQPLRGRPLSVRFRGQVPAGAGALVYELDIVERDLAAAEPFLVANVDLKAAGRTIGRLENVGLRLAPGAEPA